MMNLTVFSRYISAMTEEQFDEPNSDLKISDVPFRKLYRTVVRHFDDQDKNLKRWMLGKPCRFISPVTGTEIEVEIGKDVEALYYFLLFCYKINNNEEISEDFTDYLALVIARSQYSCDAC